MAKLLDDLMTRVGADWEPVESRENIITISARLPWEHVAMVDSLTMERLSTTRTDSLKILIEAGFEWREPGCSMCLAMNADKLQPGEHCASTSNRNFEGRQGNGGRTHLVSPAMAAAAAIAGHFVDVRSF